MQKENLYQIQVGEIIVQIEYAKNGKKINECILNILKRKIDKNNL